MPTILYLINASLGLVFIWQLALSLKFNYILLAIASIGLWLSYSLDEIHLDILWSNIFVFLGLISYVHNRAAIVHSHIVANITIMTITLFLWLAMLINPLGITLVLAIIILELTLFYHYVKPIYWQYWLIIGGLALIWFVLPPLPALLLINIIALIESLIWLYFKRGAIYFRWLFYAPLAIILAYFYLDVDAWLIIFIPLFALSLWLHSPILLFALTWFVSIDLLNLNLAYVAMGHNHLPSLGISLALVYYLIRYLNVLSYSVIILLLILMQGQFWLQYNSTAKFHAAQLAIQTQQPLLAQQYYHYVLRNYPENTATYVHLLRLSCYYPQQIIPPSIQHEVLPQLANKIIDNNGIAALMELLPLVADCESINADEMQTLLQLLRHNAPTQYQSKLDHLIYWHNCGHTCSVSI